MNWPDDFINKIAQVKYEPELVLRGPALVLPNHTAVGSLGPLLDILAADKGK